MRTLSIAILLILTIALLITTLSLPALAQDTDATANYQTESANATLAVIAPPRGPSLESIDAAEAAWNALDIDDYTLHVEFVGVWGGQDVRIRVENKLPTQWRADGLPGLMPGTGFIVGHLQPRDYTIKGLFELARRRAAARPWASVGFHTTYHFPVSISFDDPEVMDGYWSLGVTHFLPRPPGRFSADRRLSQNGRLPRPRRLPASAL